MTQSKKEHSTYLTQFEINLSAPPKSLRVINQNEARLHLAVGDAHGNWFKIIHNAFSFGTVSSDDPQFFVKMRALYDALTQAPLDKSQFKDYLVLLSTCSVKPGIKDIFLGDTRCDRGQNDLLTLAWFAHLHDQQSTFKIIFSNHDLDGLQPKIDFMQSYIKMDEFTRTFYASRYYMEQFLESNQDDSELQDLYQHYEQVYMKHLALIDYTVTEKNRIIVYTHAGCGMETVQALAKKYQVTYNESTIKHLCETIKKINVQFKNHLEQDFDWKLLSKYRPDNPHKADPLFNVIMTRELSLNFRDQPVNTTYQVYHVHGHNGDLPYIRNIPVYLTAIPLSLPIPVHMECKIKAKEAIYIITNTETPTPEFYIVGLDAENQITDICFLGEEELNQSLQKWRNESHEQLTAWATFFKKVASTEQSKQIDLRGFLHEVPFAKHYLNDQGIRLSYAPTSLTNLDGGLGKYHSIITEGELNVLFEKTYLMKMLSSTPHPLHHQEVSMKQKRNTSMSFFRTDSEENREPNSPERPRKKTNSTPDQGLG